MKQRLGCEMRFDPEALRDGRLSGDARTRFERHLRTCAACRAETKSLETVALALRALPAATDGELEFRRKRQRLLASYSESIVAGLGEPVSRRRVPWLVAGVTCALLLVASVRGLRSHGRGNGADAVIVTSNGAASWTRLRDGALTRVRLEDGDVQLRVDHSDPSARLVVTLPDGEIQDIGTVFEVRVEGHVTRAVTVTEGMVVLTLRDQVPVALASGQSWEVAPAPSALTSAAPTAAASPVAPQLPAAETKRPHAPKPLSRTDAASKVFREAVDALNHGRFDSAASQLLDFCSHQPADARVEDAVYLRIVALHRAGHEAEAKNTAEEYLKAYPSGFRRHEVEKLTRARPSSER